MTEGDYSRERVNELLTRSKLPPSTRIIPVHYLEAPLGVAPGDSRFCSKADGFVVLYASPDFATAFIETIVRDRFTRIETQTGLDVFFADPYAAWQRGTNENTNGLLRQYFPKGTNFTSVSNEDLETATRLLNLRPRKCLAYQTPHEVLMEARLVHFLPESAQAAGKKSLMSPKLLIAAKSGALPN